MRALLASLILLPSLAVASPFENGTFHDVVVRPPPAHPTGPVKSAPNISHLIYLNNCMPNGCTVMPGNDDSRTGTSSIPQSQSHLAAWAWGTTNWNQLVTCVKQMYAPFNVQITDQDPGPSVNHFELMVGGNSTDIGVQGAGGVAPFIPCDGQVQDNVISFVFSAETSDLDYLCWAAAQETSHVFGLDHEMNALDPMTYLSPPVKKQGFQNTASPCGEYMNRTCYCQNPTQNSFQYLSDTLGPAHLDPATLSIDSPADGAWVKPGFPIHATAMSQLSVTSAQLDVDGASVSTSAMGVLAFNAPSTLTSGPHTVQVTATDTAARQFSASVTVNVMSTCAAGSTSCGKGFDCLGGYCLPNAATPGGLGASCTGNADCTTGECAASGNDMRCTAPCDNGTSCPSGFACEPAGATPVCWPAAKSGGCATSGGGSPLLALGTLGALLASLRRRR